MSVREKNGKPGPKESIRMRYAIKPSMIKNGSCVLGIMVRGETK